MKTRPEIRRPPWGLYAAWVAAAALSAWFIGFIAGLIVIWFHR